MKPKYSALVLWLGGTFMAWLGIVHLHEGQFGVKTSAAQIVAGFGMMMVSLKYLPGKDENKKPPSN